MIIIKLIGGLGNQLFQYAAGRLLAEKLGCPLKLDVTGYKNQSGLTPRYYELGVFNIKESFANIEDINLLKNKKRSFFQKLFGIKKIYYYSEKNFGFNEEFLNLTKNTYLNGYWQSEKYFLEISDILRKEFSFKNPPDRETKNLLNQIKHINSVSLHIRRGDYVSDSQTKAAHYVDLEEYYKKAVNYIMENSNNPHFYIFSDDPQWVKDNFIKDFDYTIIDFNPTDKGYEDLRLMSTCKHNIIANSSFSWWGAWLNNNPEKIVIAPSKWFNISEYNTKDLIPESWIIL